jgi:SAM-dependent methyltransferase
MLKEEYLRNYRFEERYWWFVGRRHIISRLLRHNCSRIPDLRIVDLGCGTGLLTAQLNEFGKVFAMDAAKEAIDFSCTRGLANLVQGDSTDLPFADGVFDLACSFDMLEHVENDDLAIREIFRVLRPGGKCLVTVPAFKFLWSGQDVVALHKRRYSYGVLLRKIKAAGFRVRMISYFNFFLFPMIALVISLKKILSRNHLQQSNLSELPAWLNLALIGIFSLEGPILKYAKLPFGVSLICLAEKT